MKLVISTRLVRNADSLAIVARCQNACGKPSRHTLPVKAGETAKHHHDTAVSQLLSAMRTAGVTNVQLTDAEFGPLGNGFVYLLPLGK